MTKSVSLAGDYSWLGLVLFVFISAWVQAVGWVTGRAPGP